MILRGTGERCLKSHRRGIIALSFICMYLFYGTFNVSDGKHPLVEVRVIILTLPFRIADWDTGMRKTLIASINYTIVVTAINRQ